MEVVFLFVMVIGLMLIGVPIAVSLGMSSILFLLLLSDTSLASIAQTFFQAMAGHYTLLAIPFFILASSFMSTGGVAKRIIRFSIALVGHFHGGLAIAGVFACMLFAALSGSSPATVVAIGSIVIAGMRQVGYSKDFAAGVIANAGTLGILIPPSIVMVVYASATDVSVGRMFLAGVIPGLMAGTMLMVTIYIIARIRALPKGEWKGWGEVFESGAEAGWGLFLIVIILGGIYGGIFTPTEAAAVAAVYAFFIATFVYRDMGPLSRPEGERNLSLMQKPIALVTAFVHRDTRDTLFEAGKLTVTLMFIIANALILKHVLTDEQIPQQIAASMLATELSAATFIGVPQAAYFGDWSYLQFAFGAEDRTQARERARRFTLSGAAENIECPVLVVHSDGDEICPLTEAQRTATTIGDNAELVVFEGGNHCCDNMPAVVRPLMADWIAGQLVNNTA